MTATALSRTHVRMLTVLACLILPYSPLLSLAQETVCARVVLEIAQELTLERQAFDARMRITNNSDDEEKVIEDVDVEVVFSDAEGNPIESTSDGSNTNVDFFITLDSEEGFTAEGEAGGYRPVLLQRFTG